MHGLHDNRRRRRELTRRARTERHTVAGANFDKSWMATWAKGGNVGHAVEICTTLSFPPGKSKVFTRVVIESRSSFCTWTPVWAVRFEGARRRTAQMSGGAGLRGRAHCMYVVTKIK